MLQQPAAPGVPQAPVTLTACSASFVAAPFTAALNCVLLGTLGFDTAAAQLCCGTLAAHNALRCPCAAQHAQLLLSLRAEVGIVAAVAPSVCGFALVTAEACASVSLGVAPTQLQPQAAPALTQTFAPPPRPPAVRAPRLLAPPPPSQPTQGSVTFTAAPHAQTAPRAPQAPGAVAATSVGSVATQRPQRNEAVLIGAED